jgi:hypothetical protein
MPEPLESEAKSEPLSAARLQRSGMIFSWAGKIGFWVLLYFVSLLIAAPFARIPRALWMICFDFSLLALAGHLAAWFVLSYRSIGYGISGSFLILEYWLLVMASTVSASFAFGGYRRYLVLFLLVSGISLLLLFTPMLWVGPVRAIGRLLRPSR